MTGKRNSKLLSYVGSVPEKDNFNSELRVCLFSCLTEPCHPNMPATRARSIAPRFDSYKPTTTTKPSSPRGARHHNCSSDSLSSFSFSDDCEVTIPLTVKRKDETQHKKRSQKPAIDPSDVIEISDDDEPSRHLDSQTSMVADFRRQIIKLREVLGSSVQFKK